VAIVKEYRCLAHGAFESSSETPLCPAGCESIEREFRTPVGFRSERTSAIDATVQTLAKRHGMTDINNRGGKAAKSQGAAQRVQQEQFDKFIHERYGDGWGLVPQGGTMNVKTGVVEGSGPGAVGAIAKYGARPDNVLSEVKEALVPKPVIFKKDHENLKVDVSKAPA